MRIAVTYEGGQIFQHFGHTEAFKLYDAEDGKIIKEEVVSTNGQGHGALSGFLLEHGVQTLICGGIGGGAQSALADNGIAFFGGVQGSADDAVAAFLGNTLVFHPDVTCSHHNHGHCEGTADKIYDVAAMGEVLIDFTMNGVSGQGNNMFEACPGGAPCNVLAMLSKLGKKTAFIGKAGDDQFGRLLKGTIEEAGIEAKGLVLDKGVNTTLAFVHTYPDGDREFSFYRRPGADMMLGAQEVDDALIRQAKIFHFGTLSMTDEPVRNATKKALETAKEAGCLISFDPNLRPPLWDDMKTAKEMMEYGFGYCDILKISDNEIQFVSGLEDYDEGIRYLQTTYQIPLILLTLGKDGSRAYYKDMRVEESGFTLNTVETTGAGDTFCGSTLGQILDLDFNNLTEKDLSRMLLFANAAAALITTKKGAIRSMPEKEEVIKLMNERL